MRQVVNFEPDGTDAISLGVSGRDVSWQMSVQISYQHWRYVGTDICTSKNESGKLAEFCEQILGDPPKQFQI